MNFSYDLFCTDISYKFGDENNGDIQYPLISFCSDDFWIRNKILKDCNNHWTPFYQAVKKCLETDSNFKISILMDTLDYDKAQCTKMSLKKKKHSMFQSDYD